MSEFSFYPVKFAPIYMNRIWGGTMMHDLLGRDVPSSGVPVGESWEIVDRNGEQSVAVNGVWNGMSIEDILHQYGKEVLGPKGSGYDRFPLLVKLIDAGERLSLQVHPDENACSLIGGDAQPKTEMWYIIGCNADGCILAGLAEGANRDKLEKNINSPDVENMLQKFASVPGDGYFIKSGTLHAIGGGNLILEIQQNSDTTYRISDWGRVDSNGKSRELHIDKGIRSINFNDHSDCRIDGVENIAGGNNCKNMVGDCPFFRIDAVSLVSEKLENTFNDGSFHILSCAEGCLVIKTTDDEVKISKGESLLVPYALGEYIVAPAGRGSNILIKTTL